MLLVIVALAILLSGFVANRLELSAPTKRRMLLIAGLTLLLVLALGWMRLGPLAALALVVGGGLAALQAMQEIGRRGDFDELGDAPPPPLRRSSGMERAEALAVLGLQGEPDGEAISAAHKRMILRAHPDQGGSDYLATKVNEAKRVLLPKD